MAKIMNILNLEIPAWKAQPAPPLGPMLWANWVNIWQFTKEFNEKTSEMMKFFSWADVKIKCKLTIFADRTFTLELGKPVTSNLILWKIHQKLWSGEPNKKNIGKLTRKDLEEIVELKKWDMNTDDIEAMIRIIWWTAKNMWVDVERGAIK